MAIPVYELAKLEAKFRALKLKIIK